jgi:hypothetical protein
MKLLIARLITGITLFSSSLVYADENSVPYPNDYRNWTHVKTMLIEPGHALENPFQGIHHVYANEKALQGLKHGSYQDGAVLVFDLLNYVEADKTIQEGTRKLTGIMHKDEKKYTQTGGWGFEGFAGDSKTERLVKDGGMSCFGCHAPQKASDYVFSKFRN